MFDCRILSKVVLCFVFEFPQSDRWAANAIVSARGRENAVWAPLRALIPPAGVCVRAVLHFV